MRKRITMAVIAALCAAALMLGGCSTVEKVRKATGKDVDVLESAFFCDEDTGQFKAVVFIENNTLNPIQFGFVEARGYDENDNAIDAVKIDSEENRLSITYNWLCTGEKTVALFTGEGMDDPFYNINSYFAEVPAALKWKSGFTSPDPEIVPHGLSVTSCVPDDSGLLYSDETTKAYAVTIHNDSDADYIYDPDSMQYTAPGHTLDFDTVAVYRDADGVIRDAERIYYVPVAEPGDLKAGSDTVLHCYCADACTDDSLTPEYYISITEYESGS